MNVALDGGDDNLAVGAGGVGVALLGLDERDEFGDGFLHDAGALDDLGQEHAAGAEEVSDDVHAVHEGAFDDVEGAVGGLAGFFYVGLDVGVYAVDEGVLDAVGDGERTPGVVLGGLAGGAANGVGDGEKTLGGVGTAVEDDVLYGVAQVERDVFIDAELSGVDDAHVHARAGGVVEEDGVDGLAHGVVAAEGEGDVGDAPTDVGEGEATL